jgi:hypothetical protein
VCRHLPPSLLKAPKKGFWVPLREWFKQDDFNGRLKELERSDFGLDNSVISDIVQDTRSGHNDHGDFIWRLFVLKHWIEAPTGSLVNALDRKQLENRGDVLDGSVAHADGH